MSYVHKGDGGAGPLRVRLLEPNTLGRPTGPETDC